LTVETGALLHAPSEPELAGWKVRRTLVGLVLMIAGAIGAYLGIMGMSSDATAGDGAVLVTVVTLGASVAIGFFGLRYLSLGVGGKGVVIYEEAVEADFQSGLRILPDRRTVPLLQVRLSGSERLIYGQAITTTGHAFRLPPSLVERSDPWYLGSLGRSPIAPGGERAKESFEKGELSPFEHPTSEPLPDHGPAWPDPGTLPITVDVPVEPEPQVKVEPAEPPVARPSVPPPVVVESPARSAPADERIVPEPPTLEPEMEVVMDLPDVVPPPETPRISLPPPPRYRPRSVTVPDPPEHKEMDRDEDLEPIPSPGRVAPVTPEPQPAPPPDPIPSPPPTPPTVPAPPPEPAPELVPEPVAPAPPTSTSDDWELEELPPPEEAKKKPPKPSGWEWEEM
jgi:hypothetical protein